MSAEHDPGTGEGELASPRPQELGATYEPGPAGEPDEPAPEAAAPASEAAAPGSSPAAPATEAEQEPAASQERRRHIESPNMLPGRETRRTALERTLVRLIATCGIVGIGVAIAAIMVSSKSQGWIVGLVVSIVSVVLAALLWSSKQL